MTVSSSHPLEIPAEQRAIREKCFHPSGTFIEFQKTAIEQSIPSRFEEQVRRNPKRLAIKTGREELTYDELNNAANRVAEAILAHRGKESKPIALLFEQGAQGIAAILGALKAGKTYVPADPSIPRTRTTYILEDSQADLIVTNRQNLAMARELAQNDRQLLNIDELGSSITAGNPGLSISPDSVAWIIYTSGSTGQPKGVAQTHRCVLHMIFNYTNSLHICPDDSLSLLFSLSVHAGTFGAFCPCSPVRASMR